MNFIYFILHLCIGVLGIHGARGTGGGIANKLKTHGVEPSMQRAIAGMAKSGLSHETIVKNIQKHFPEKKKSEINDIVIAANINQRAPQARGVVKKVKTKAMR